MPDLISIITPIFNGEKFISETIESVINQTHQEWEMIIVDNCSTDSSADIIKLFQEKSTKIKYIKLDYNSGGPARPRNIGIDNAKGEYIAFLDADDVWLTKKLERQMEYMKENNINFTSTLSYKIDEKSILLKKRIKYTKKELRILESNKPEIEKILKWNFITLSTVLIKKNGVIRFNEGKNFIAVEDYRLWLMLLLDSNIKYKLQTEFLINYRILDKSLSHNNFLKQDLKTIYCILDFILATNNYKYFTIFLQKVFIKYIKSIVRSYN
jgi:teichuronic acid biosynthesis glycosyltransferase TuaG